MKKIGKRLSFLTKIVLAFGLLLSNLLPLSIVFAEEVTDDIIVSVTEDNKVNVRYTGEIDDSASVKIILTENYKYLDETTATPYTNSCSKTGAEIKSKSGTLCDSNMLTNVLFDGLYEVSVQLKNAIDLNPVNDVDLGTVTYSKNITFESGLRVEVLDGLSNKVIPSEGVYPVTMGAYTINYGFNAGGLSPSVQYTYNDVSYSGEDLIGLSESTIIDYTGHLFGEHSEIIDLENMPADYSKEIKFMYGAYSDNDDYINADVNTLGLDSIYLFGNNKKDGILFVKPNQTNIYNVYDLDQIMASVIASQSVVTYTIKTSEYNDINQAYLDYVATVEPSVTPLSPMDFYKNIELNDETVVTLTCGDLSVTYTALYLADMNEDGILTSADLQLLTDQAVGLTEGTLDKVDLNNDDELNIYDAAELYQILVSQSWTIPSITDNGEVDAKLEFSDDVDESNIVSGDTFTLDYILTIEEYEATGVEGTINYDETKLELVGIEKAIHEWVGSNKDGKFIYLTNTPQTVTDVPVGSVNAIVAPVYAATDYKVLTITFRALKAGSSEVSVEGAKFMNGLEELALVSETISTTVVVNASGDGSLSSLTVAGQNIALVDGTLGYEITVDNDNTSTAVDAIARNVAAKVSSIVVPDQLVVGENIFTVTVTAENNNTKTYTITVIRKEAPKEATPTNYQPQDDDDEENLTTVPSDNKQDDDVTDDNGESKLSRIVIIVLIVAVIGGLVYLIFKDEDGNEVKLTDKEINKLKKDKNDAFKEKSVKNKNVKNNKKER